MPLLVLPPELIVIVVSYISDPLDLMAVRLTHRALDNCTAPRFDQLYNTPVDGNRFPLSSEYLRLGPWACCVDGDYERDCYSDPDLARLHHPMLYRDASLYHAVVNNHYRHARFLCSSPYPTLEIDDLAHEISWVGWEEGLAQSARNGQTEMLQLLLAHKRPNEPDIWKANSVQWAVLSGHIDEAVLLIQNHIPCINRGFCVTAEYIAILRHEVELLEWMLVVRPVWPWDEREILAAVTGGRDKGGRGWCQRLLWRILEEGTPVDRMVESDVALVGHEDDEFRELVSLNPDIGLCIGDSVLHAAVKAGRRNCGTECHVWKGVQRRLTEEELWDELVGRGANPDHVNSLGVSARTLMETKSGRPIEQD